MTITHFLPPAALTLSLLTACASTTPAVEQTTPPPAPQAQTQGPPANAVAKEMAEFVARVERYHALRQTLNAKMPQLSAKPAPEELDTHQRTLAALVMAARTGAKPGDIFVPEMQTVVRSLMAQVFKNAVQRAELKATIAEENPTGVKVVVNTQYPEGLALTTMPPDVLKNLPLLPKDCEYRFVGESLILLDTRTNLVLDVMSFALPRG